MLEQLQRQMYEIEALNAVFSDGDVDFGGGGAGRGGESSGVKFGSALLLSPPELQTLQLAQQICEAAEAAATSGHVRDSGAGDDEGARDIPLLGLPLLSGTIRPPLLQLGGQPVALRFALPRGYPGGTQTSSSDHEGAGDSDGAGGKIAGGGLGVTVHQAGADCQGVDCGQKGTGRLEDAGCQGSAGDLCHGAGGIGGNIEGRGDRFSDDAGCSAACLIGMPVGATAAGSSNPQLLPGQLFPGSGHRRAWLSVECSAQRHVHERLSAVVAAVADRQAEVGCECLLLAVDALKDAVEKELQGGKVDAKPPGRLGNANGEGNKGEADGEGKVPAAATVSVSLDTNNVHGDGIGRGRSQCSDSIATTGPSTPAGNEVETGLLCSLVWLHHLKSMTKRKLIVQWARELQLGGACKPGFPGVVVVEGHSDDVREFLQRMRSLSWQAMQVRGQDLLPLTTTNNNNSNSNNSNNTTNKAIQMNSTVSSSGGSRSVAITQRVESLRRLPRPHDVPFAELGEEGGMSALGAMCRAAGLRHVFMTALKL